ncbi:chemotaxis protein CheD [Deltaproteobacteria bacterium TL4]
MGQIIRVSIGGAEIGRKDDRLFTVVGSCVAIMLYDKKCQIGGMVHIMLGYANGRTDNPGKYADTGTRYLIQKMVKAGAANHRLTGAKIAGGGEMFENYSKDLNVSASNVKAVHEVLAQHNIKIIAADCGGSSGRRITFDVGTGKVLIEAKERETIIL